MARRLPRGGDTRSPHEHTRGCGVVSSWSPPRCSSSRATTAGRRWRRGRNDVAHPDCLPEPL
jgi:hypothetical protein